MEVVMRINIAKEGWIKLVESREKIVIEKNIRVMMQYEEEVEIMLSTKEGEEERTICIFSNRKEEEKIRKMKEREAYQKLRRNTKI